MTTPNSIFLRNERECRCIALTKILYICVDNYLATFYLGNGDKFICSKSLSEIESILTENFFRLSRNCIVNLNAVTTIETRTRTVVMVNNIRMPFSYRKTHLLKVAYISVNRLLTS
jgi:DNA-binding LytR/AlgR family response regulator